MTTPAEIFANMPDRFSSEKASGLELTVAFDLTGDNGGQWAVQIADGKCSIVEGTVDNAAATVSMTAEDYVAMSTGKLNPMMAFMSGKVKVDGDLNSVMKFQQLFGM